LPEDNLLNLNKSINVVKSNVGELAGGIDTLANKFDNLSNVLRIDGYVQLNATYTQLTRNMALTSLEAEKLSKTVDIMSQRISTYSRKELANLTAIFQSSTGTISTFRGGLDQLAERFANKYKKDADVYAKALERLTSQFPDISIAMQRGAKDVETLAYIMRVSGREGVSSYLAAINQIPDETENSLNKTELQVKKLQSTWDNAKINLGRTLSTIFDPLVGAANKVGEFAQSHPLATNVVAAGGSTASSIAMMYVQARMIRGAVGGGGLLGGGVPAAVASTVGSIDPFTGAPISAATGGGFAGMSRMQRMGAGAGIFALGHLGTQALTDEGSDARLGMNFGTNIAAGAMAGGPYGAIAAGVITAGVEITSALNANTKALVEKKEIEKEFKAERLSFSSRGPAANAADASLVAYNNLPFDAGYNERVKTGQQAAKDQEAKATEAEQIVKIREQERKAAEAVSQQAQAVLDKTSMGGSIGMGQASPEYNAAQRKVIDANQILSQAIKNEEVQAGEAEKARKEAIRLQTVSNLEGARGRTVQAAEVGKSEKLIQLSMQYGGAGGEGLPLELSKNLSKQREGLELQLKSLSGEGEKEQRAIVEGQIKEIKLREAFAPEAARAELRMAGAAIRLA
jgi:hypothetical protein